MLVRLGLILLVGSVGKFGLVVLDWYIGRVWKVWLGLVGSV